MSEVEEGDGAEREEDGNMGVRGESSLRRELV